MKYTHRDCDGVLWRFSGGRPVSEIADLVMLNTGFPLHPEEVPTYCAWCQEPILPGERADNQGGDFHQECLFRAGAGSVGHILHRCSCHGGNQEDPPGLTKREAARAAREVCRELQKLVATYFPENETPEAVDKPTPGAG